MPTRNDESTLRVVPTGGALAADVWGVDIENLSDSQFERIRQAWTEHDGVLRIPGQFVEVESMIAFAARFGELDVAPISANGPRARPDLPHLTTISNIIENGRALGGLGHYESKWHTDMSYNDIPPMASVLHAVELPKVGGDTGYCNMYKAYETLPDDLKQQIQNLSCKHDSSRSSVGQVRKGFAEQYPNRDEAPGAVHPLVCVHPETARPCLYLGRRSMAFIPDLEPAQSDLLLDQLWAHAAQDEFCWYQRWRLGDIVIWDNRCTMHRRDGLDPNDRRLLNRTQVKGAQPIAIGAIAA
ncbi:MAG: taurine dioxygenase [Gammaproteobacteria bacterium]|jgi:taurine dioxygenase